MTLSLATTIPYRADGVRQELLNRCGMTNHPRRWLVAATFMADLGNRALNLVTGECPLRVRWESRYHSELEVLVHRSDS